MPRRGSVKGLKKNYTSEVFRNSYPRQKRSNCVQCGRAIVCPVSQKYCRICRPPKIQNSKNKTARVKAPQVYLAFDSSGTIIYVGRTNQFELRIKKHMQDGSAWLVECQSIDILLFSNYGDSLVEEAILIRDYQPKYNKTGVFK